MKIPYVKAVDKDTGIEVKGFYFEYPSTTYCFLEDYSSFSVPLIPCIVSYTSGDWGLPNNPKLCQNIDRNSLEILGYVETDNETYVPNNWIIKDSI